MTPDHLVLGIDAGGTKTVAWLARCARAGEPVVVGRGTAGAANPQTVGWAETTANLDRAVAAAFDQTSLDIEPVAAAVLAVAGSDRDENRTALGDWAKRRRLARRFRVVHDALPVLAAGSPDGSGVALVAGTGSLAFGRSPDGRTARAGGWGYLLGDEGSGYAVAIAGLRAAARCADGRGPATRLLERLLGRLTLQEPPELVSAISRLAADRAAIAALAEVVTATADGGDTVAEQIIDKSARELTQMVAAVARKLDLPSGEFPLALAGGLLLGSQSLQAGLTTHLNALGLLPGALSEVPQPVVGALKMAQADALAP
jgi:N-acetylmuramic acid 6-phosphate etherase